MTEKSCSVKRLESCSPAALRPVKARDELEKTVDKESTIIRSLRLMIHRIIDTRRFFLSNRE